MRLEYHRRTDTAIELLRRKMRVSVVSRITDIHPRTLRSLYREIHGHKSVSGQIPTTSGILRTWPMQASASMFAALYRSVGETGVNDQINIDALVRSHDIYREQSVALGYPELDLYLIDITQAWVIARDLSAGIAYFKLCRRCLVHYLLAELSRLPPTCPVCVLKSGRHSAAGVLKQSNVKKRQR